MLAAGPSRAAPEESRYRVEILVLTHLDHDQEPDEVQVLEDFSEALDFLTPPPEEEAAESAGSDEAASSPAADVGGDEMVAESETGAGEDLDAEPACSVVPVTEMGPEMQEAWRRLRLSRPFRPLQYLAWEQPGEPPFPELRIHDLETVLTEDPWQHLREPALEEDGDTALVFGDTVTETPVEEMDEPTEADEGPLPSPILYFRLDGTAQLVRTRFLHLAVTVELREPVFDPLSMPPQVIPEVSDGAAPESDRESEMEPQPTSFLIQRLDQRRQVKTGRMEYFDGPVLGVLAFITDVSDTLDEATIEE